MEMGWWKGGCGMQETTKAAIEGGDAERDGDGGRYFFNEMGLVMVMMMVMVMVMVMVMAIVMVMVMTCDCCTRSELRRKE